MGNLEEHFRSFFVVLALSEATIVVVNSTTHIHLDESRCLEIISVRGRMDRIQALAKYIMRKRGVTQLKLSTVAV